MRITTGLYTASYCGLRAAHRAARKMARRHPDSTGLVSVQDHLGLAKNWVRARFEKKRISPAEAMARFAHYLEEIYSELHSFERLLKEGLSVLEREGLEAFSKTYLPKIINKSRILADLEMETDDIRDRVDFDAVGGSGEMIKLQIITARHNSNIYVLRFELIGDLIKAVVGGNAESAAGKLRHLILSAIPHILSGVSTWLEVYRNGTEYKRTDIRPLIGEMAKIYRPRVEQKGLNFCFEMRADEAFCLIDANLFKMILTNLLDNAIKYTPAGEIKVSVFTAKDRAQRDCLCVKVEDTGIGIPPEERNKIFERAYRASNVGEIRGDGIGLDFVHAAVHGMGGHIELESELNRGSAFTVFFPLATNA